MMIDEQLDEKPITKPPARWRNWWRLYPPTYVRCNSCMTFHRGNGAPWDYDGCCQTYESEFDAKFNAKEDYDPSCDQAKVEWLGAYPDGERP
jgi:hypothetical protein